MKKNTSSASLKAARAELAAKRRRRKVQFAHTVLGWQDDETVGIEAAFPATVLGWDHPAAQVGANVALGVSAARSIDRSRARHRGFIWVGTGLITVCAGVLLALLH
jgi:hypothetical protein